MKPALHILVLIGALALAASAPASRSAVPGQGRGSHQTGSSACQQGPRALAAAARVAGIHTYDDFIEDSGAAPDFCAANAVTNDNRAVTIGIHVHNRSGLAPNDAYSILFDTDADPTTGGSGAELLLAFDAGGPQLSRWNGASFDVFAPQSPIVLEWLPGYGPVLQVSRSDLGDPARFDFVLVSGNAEHADRAPDRDAWSYPLTPLKLTVASLRIGRARAGRPFVARMLVMRSDFETELTEGTIRCRAKVAAKRLAGRGSFLGDRASCTWQLPKTARGKRLSGSVAVSFQGAQAERAFSVTVRP
ncbi:MAG TPA: hypothetical protein VGQ15_01925 [Gaiellaceae bacterium]|jgi:hypothetical protein|nr:hypothetical protein [Gaiellaceae bacterium]